MFGYRDTRLPEVGRVGEFAGAEPGPVAQSYAILNCDDHANFIKKHKRDPADYRPDILHQARLHR